MQKARILAVNGVNGIDKAISAAVPRIKKIFFFALKKNFIVISPKERLFWAENYFLIQLII